MCTVLIEVDGEHTWVTMGVPLVDMVNDSQHVYFYDRMTKDPGDSCERIKKDIAIAISDLEKCLEILRAL